MRIKAFGSDYGEASVTVRFTCLIEQLVNLLAALANEPEMLSTNEIQVTGGTDKNKTIQVRLTLSGVVSKKLVPRRRPGARCESQTDLVERRAGDRSGLWRRAVAQRVQGGESARSRAAPGPYLTGAGSALRPAAQRPSGSAVGLQGRGDEDPVSPVAQPRCAGGIAAPAAASAAHAGAAARITDR